MAQVSMPTENRTACNPDVTWLRFRGKQYHTYEQTQSPSRERQDGDMSEALHLGMWQCEFPKPQPTKQIVTFLVPRALCIERRLDSSFDLGDDNTSGLYALNRSSSASSVTTCEISRTACARKPPACGSTGVFSPRRRSSRS